MSFYSDVAVAPVEILVVEDQTVMRHLLAAHIAGMPRFAVVGEAGTVAEALELAAARRPQVVVLDWMLPDGIGLDFLRRVRVDPPPRVLIFSSNTTELAIREAFSAGAVGFIEKTASVSELNRALDAVAAGRSFQSRVVATIMNRRAFSSTELTERERTVLRLIAEGLSSKQIADRLQLSIRTVENRRAIIMQRTGLRSVAALVLHAVRLGLAEVSVPATAQQERAHSFAGEGRESYGRQVCLVGNDG